MARAGTPDGGEKWAFSIGMGANYAAQSELDGAALAVDYDLGIPRFRGALARRLGDNWWLELELAQRKSKAEFIIPDDGSPSLDPGASDKVSSAGLSLSLIREFSAGPWLSPYLGFGAGPNLINYRLSVQAPGGVDAVPLVDDDTTALAVQAVAGLRFPLTRTLDLSVAYEWWHAAGLEFNDVTGADVELDQSMHSGWVNLSYYPGASRAGGFSATRATGPAPAGFYLVGGAGVNWIKDVETGPLTFDAFKPGALFSVGVGRTLGRRWRGELEYAYRSNDAQVVDFGNQYGEQRLTGDLRTSSLSANLYFDLLPDAPVRPSIGLGIGTTKARYDVNYHADGTTLVDDSVTKAFAQLSAGVGIEISRALILDVGWRMWISSDHDVQIAGGETLDVDLNVHSVEFALRYALGSR